MSRSYRHTLIHGITTARSEKDDKRALNQAWRSRTNAILKTACRMTDEDLDALILPDTHNDIMSVWSMSKDGRRWWGNGSRVWSRSCSLWKIYRK